ncbi:hypothetical protein ACHAW6_000665 [Cyclotella cf. meneghiniana]
MKRHSRVLAAISKPLDIKASF